MAARNALLLGAELLLYFGALAILFRLRRQLGIGVFVAALGTMHFLETYLAASLYVGVPGGIVVSPGSSVLFAGKLVLLLLVYVKEDATAVRQPIYGLLAGNVLILGLVLLLRRHEAAAGPGGPPDLGFIGDMGWLMVWGSVILYLDSLAIVLVYETLGRLIHRVTPRIWVAAALVLTFDQIAFFVALHLLFGAGTDVLVGGWIAKMVSGAVYALLTGLYLRVFEREVRAGPAEAPLLDLFGTLTYRERYHALLETSGRDALTGALNRGRLEQDGRRAVDLALGSGQEVTLALIDLDGFKAINDRFGHATGDDALRRLAAAIRAEARPTDYVFRYGGDEFLVCAIGMTSEAAMGLADRLAAALRTTVLPGTGETLAGTVGIATGPREGRDYEALFRLADERLYAGKAISRFRTWSVPAVAGPGEGQDAHARTLVRAA